MNIELRDYFAGQAMAGILANQAPYGNAATPEDVVASAYRIADEMLERAALGKPGPDTVQLARETDEQYQAMLDKVAAPGSLIGGNTKTKSASRRLWPRWRKLFRVGFNLVKAADPFG